MAQALHLVEGSAIEQLKALQEETSFSYEHLTLMLSKIRKYQRCQRNQSPDPIEEDSLDYVPNAVEVQASHFSLPTSKNGRSTWWGPTHTTPHVLDIQTQASHLCSLFHWAPETPTGTRDVGPGAAPLNQAYGGSSTQPLV
jgi:hypothetical protein